MLAWSAGVGSLYQVGMGLAYVSTGNSEEEIARLDIGVDVRG